jgi:hypothetical protein
MTNTNEYETVRELIAHRQNELSKSDEALSAQTSVAARVIALIKEGKAKLPIVNVPATARALEVPEGRLLRIALHEYSPELLQIIDSVWQPMDLTRNVRDLIKKYQRISKGRDAFPVVIRGVAIIAPKSE